MGPGLAPSHYSSLLYLQKGNKQGGKDTEPQGGAEAKAGGGRKIKNSDRTKRVRPVAALHDRQHHEQSSYPLQKHCGNSDSPVVSASLPNTHNRP